MIQQGQPGGWAGSSVAGTVVGVAEATTTTRVGVTVSVGAGVRVGGVVGEGKRAPAVCVISSDVCVFCAAIWVSWVSRCSTCPGARNSAYPARQPMLIRINSPIPPAAKRNVRLDDSSGGGPPTSKSSAMTSPPPDAPDGAQDYCRISRLANGIMAGPEPSNSTRALRASTPLG